MITPRARFSISPPHRRVATLSCERPATDQRSNAFADHFRRGPDGEVNAPPLSARAPESAVRRRHVVRSHTEGSSAAVAPNFSSDSSFGPSILMVHGQSRKLVEDEHGQS
jgi:hypothetical protein